MPLLAWDQLPDRVNRDAEFAIAGRDWTATLRLDVGDEHTRLRFEAGALTEIEPCTENEACDVFVAAPKEEWEKLLAATPRPFYQDLFGAQLHHDVRLNPDALAYAAYYPALRRLVQILRDVKEAG